MTAPPLSLEGVAHRFGRRWVLRGLDLDVMTGEVVALAGSNGAGKTTLLRIAATLLRPMRGGGRVAGHSLIEASHEVRRRIGLLGHSAALYEDLTAAENLAFTLRMRAEPADRRRILSLLDTVGLVDRADTQVRRFSTGMRRRVGVARVLAAEPDLLLMDEPYASLDREGVTVINDLIEGTASRGGGVLFVTHDLRSGAELTDRVLTLNDGRLEEGLL